MRYFKIILSITLAFYIYFASTSFGDGYPPSPIETIGKDTEWLNADYLKTLKETKSTFKASKDIHYTAIFFKLKEKAIEWMQCYNFHEGLGYNLEGFEKKEGLYYPIFSHEQWSDYHTKESTFAFSGNPADKTEWSFVEKYNDKNPGEKKRLTFFRAEPDIKTLINRLTIAGKYKDSKGLLYFFSEGGKAVWPDRSFDYEVNADPILGFDYFTTSVMVENNMHEIQKFEWNNGRLLLFRVTYNGDFIKDDNPFLVLTPVE